MNMKFYLKISSILVIEQNFIRKCVLKCLKRTITIM